MGGTRGLCIATDCQQVFSLCSPTLFLSPTFPPPHLPYTLRCQFLRSELNKSVSLKGHIIIPYLFFFFFFTGMRGLTRRLDQISQFAMETTWEGTSNYWREMVDSKDKDKEGNSKLSTTDTLQCRAWQRGLLLCDKWQSLRGHRGDVSA